jgi:integrase
VIKLADAIDARFRAVIYTGAYSGMRAGELAALRIENTHLIAREVEVVASMSEIGGTLVPGPTKTGKARTIGLPGFLCDMLGEHIARYPSSDGFVFTMAEGGPIRHRNLYRRHFKPAVARAGLDPELHFHALRHTCAALLIARGRHMEEIKVHLGHSSIRVTSDRYGHLFPSARRSLGDGLDALYRTSLDAPADVKSRYPGDTLAPVPRRHF